MRLTHYRRFHDWKPGTLYMRSPVKTANIQHEYENRLAAAIEENIPKLASQLRLPADSSAINRQLLTQNSPQYWSVRRARSAVSKREWAPSQEYAAFLRHLYAQPFPNRKVLAALNELPGVEKSLQALYIESTHLELLINRAMDSPRDFLYIFRMLEAAGMPQTSREVVAGIIGVFLHHGNWREALTRHWPQLSASHDTDTFNQLLKLALMARCRETQRLVQYHLELNPNRFTYLIKLRYQHDALPSDLMHEFQKRRFVVDTIALTSYITALLNMGKPEALSSAEHVFESLQKTAWIKPEFGNRNMLASCLKALDRVNQITQKHYEVPLYMDATLFSRMHKYFLTNVSHARALDALVSMAKHGHIAIRPQILLHMSHLQEQSDLEELFYLCCDINMSHPGFMSVSLANKWTNTIAKFMSYEDALRVVSHNREVCA